MECRSQQGIRDDVKGVHDDIEEKRRERRTEEETEKRRRNEEEKRRINPHLGMECRGQQRIRDDVQGVHNDVEDDRDGREGLHHQAGVLGGVGGLQGHGVDGAVPCEGIKIVIRTTIS